MARSTGFLSHAQLLAIRHDATLRKRALSTYGPQGVLDIALLGAILGNNIREIGRYMVTCDGSIVRGRYSIYELVHFGILAVTGRRCQSKAQVCYGEQSRRPSSTSVMSEYSIISDSTRASTYSSSTDSRSSSSHCRLERIYPATLANLFPALVFKALRRKSVRSPKFQHDDSASSTPVSSVFQLDSTSNRNSSTHISSGSGDNATQQPIAEHNSVDSVLITSEAVLANLVQQKMHRVKDLPLPRELCFLGAVSLPLPPALRAMHIAWTMDFLNTRVTTAHRQRRQRRQAANMAAQEESANSTTLGGLEFRPDIYAYNMRVARLARAQQQHTAMKRAGGASGDDSAPMRRGPSSTSIPEENEEEMEGRPSSLTSLPSADQAPSQLNDDSPPVASSTTYTFVRQDKRLMQQLLSLENKVPRIIRHWAATARTCFAEELLQEDRLVQEWVDRQRIQVVLGCGYRLGHSSTAGSVALSQKRSTLSPISTTLANSIAGVVQYQQDRAPLSPLSKTGITIDSPSWSPSHIPVSATRTCFPDGVRLGTGPVKFRNRASQGQSRQSNSLILGGTDLTIPTCSRPTSGSMSNRLSASQQMLSMHLWLSLLVSPLSPEHMVHDQLGFMDS